MEGVTDCFKVLKSPRPPSLLKPTASLGSHDHPLGKPPELWKLSYAQLQFATAKGHRFKTVKGRGNRSESRIVARAALPLSSPSRVMQIIFPTLSNNVL